MLKKQQIIEAINEMQGDEVDVEAVKEKLYLLQELQKAENDITAGRIYTNEQMKEIVESWRHSHGQILPKAI